VISDELEKRMDLSTTYLGFTLPHPFMPGASPLVDDLDMVRRLEDAGAAAIVMHSLFEEQLVGEQLAHAAYTEGPADSFAEALSYFPHPSDFALGPEEYLEQLRRIKAAVAVPVIASLNGRSAGGWLTYARLLAEAGADALELNIYELATDPRQCAAVIEDRMLAMVRRVRDNLRIPVAVKLSPFYTALAHLAQRLDNVGVDGMVLFNRLYQPDIDVEQLEVARTLQLSDSSELPLRVTWLAVVAPYVHASLAVRGGVHTAVDAVKAVMAGAHAVQMVSALLRHGPEHLRAVREATAHWLEAHEYESLRQLRGSMNLQHCPDPQAYARANYIHVLQSWRSAEHAATGTQTLRAS
jgi:dihydroorotate dehydrogenase (fumarate)